MSKDKTAATVTAPIIEAGSASVETITPEVTTVQPIIESDAIVAARQTIATLETTIASIADASASAALAGILTASQGTLVALLKADASASERQSRLDAALTASDALPASVRQTALDAMVAAIEADYSATPEAAPEPTALAASGKKSVSPRTAERNATVAADAGMLATAEAYINAWNASDLQHCTVVRQAGTRYAGLVALASNGAGVANAAEYKLIATAVRLTLLNAPHNLRPNGEGTPDSLWLARLGRVYGVAGSKPNENLNHCFTNGAFLAQSADGRFRLATSATAGAVRVETSTAAWNAFVGASGAATVAPASDASGAASGAPASPKAPAVQADAYGSLTATLPCIHCGASNFATAPACRNKACNKFPRQADAI